VCFLFIGLSFMSGEAVEENAINFKSGAVQLLHAAAAAAALAGGATVGGKDLHLDGSAAEAAAIRQWLAASGGPWLQLLATDLDAPMGAVPGALPAGTVPRCVWRTDGWAYLGMLFIAWVMLWLISILNEVRPPELHARVSARGMDPSRATTC
jgi:hypothetical protein